VRRYECQANSVDNVCSHIKESLGGRYPQVHAKHLNAYYLDEVRCRFINGETRICFATLLETHGNRQVALLRNSWAKDKREHSFRLLGRSDLHKHVFRRRT